MADFYERLQGTASRLLGKFRQGSVVYVEPGATTGPTYAPVTAAPTLHDLDATVSGVAAKYVDGSLVLASDLQVIAAVFGAEPALSGKVAIGGRQHDIVQIDRIPGSGVVIAWRLFVRA